MNRHRLFHRRERRAAVVSEFAICAPLLFFFFFTSLEFSRVNMIRQSVENAPYQIVEEAMWQQIFPKGHPYYAYVIGSHEDIQAAKLEDVRDFFQRYYCPNNASLVIVGDIDPVKTKALVEKYYGTIPRGKEVPAITIVYPIDFLPAA